MRSGRTNAVPEEVPAAYRLMTDCICFYAVLYMYMYMLISCDSMHKRLGKLHVYQVHLGVCRAGKRPGFNSIELRTFSI